MQIIQFDNDNFVLYAPDSLNYITNDLEDILVNSLNIFKNIFDVVNFRKVRINYFDNIEDYRNFVYRLRGEKESLPQYAQGSCDDGMINAYISPSIIEGTPLYNHKMFMASHELFHIIYQELVWEKNNQKRIVWFDEGMAQFFSGENEAEMTIEFDNWFDKVKSNTKIIPNLNELEHGKAFQTENYNGYNLSLLAVKYLCDKLSFDEFKNLIKDNNGIINYGNTVLEEAFSYYNSKIIKK